MKVQLILLPVFIAVISGCSWKAYDKNNPDEYHKYWQNEDNKKNSIIYPLTNEYYEEQRQKK